MKLTIEISGRAPRFRRALIWTLAAAGFIAALAYAGAFLAVGA